MDVTGGGIEGAHAADALHGTGAQRVHELRGPVDAELHRPAEVGGLRHDEEDPLAPWAGAPVEGERDGVIERVERDRRGEGAGDFPATGCFAALSPSARGAVSGRSWHATAKVPAH